jgi:outer membrane protein assembly factor BamA
MLAAALTLTVLLAGPAQTDVAAAGSPAHTSFFPLPLYSTVPNEGSTYGFLPVFLRVSSSGEISSILAPSISWNKAAGVNTTFRYYRYPSRIDTFSVIAAASTKVNRTFLVTYEHLPWSPGSATAEVYGRARRNVFYRFFGLGPDSSEAGESSYTRRSLTITTRFGLNFPGHLNAGVRLTVRDDRPEVRAIYGLPTLQAAHPDAPGLDGAALGAVGASLRYDTRPRGDYAPRGLAAELAGGRAQGLRGFDHDWYVTAQGRALWEEASFLQGAARVYYNQLWAGRDQIPFYYQSSLGGEFLLRGFPEDRFFDHGAWEAETEQRFRVLRTRLFGVIADWRIDPFVAVGQVFPSLAQAVSNPRLTGGVGLRVLVHPNVLGRVDLAYSGEGLRAYVVLGYPY